MVVLIEPGSADHTAELGPTSNISPNFCGDVSVETMLVFDFQKGKPELPRWLIHNSIMSKSLDSPRSEFPLRAARRGVIFPYVSAPEQRIAVKFDRDAAVR